MNETHPDGDTGEPEIDNTDIDAQMLAQLEAVFEQSQSGGDPRNQDSEDGVSQHAEFIDRAGTLFDVIERLRKSDAAAQDTPGLQVDVPTQGGKGGDKGDRSFFLDAGKKFGRFEILRSLGSGGYGMVFLAKDPQLDRLVAIKVPRPQFVLTGELRERFAREARAAAALSHPNIVPVFESGDLGPASYIACQFIDGITLADWIAQQKTPIDPRRSAEMIAVLADAVQHAHQRGVVHRDLKPGNVLLEKEPGAGSQNPVKEIPRTALEKDEVQLHTKQAKQTSKGGDRIRKIGAVVGLQGDDSSFPDSWLLSPASSAKIADFGLARIIDDQIRQTKTDAIVGTPAYMSPEQARGDRSAPEESSDIYSLGAILYELLTGRPPFQEESIIETLSAVQNQEPKRPSKLVPSVPRDLEAVCLKCLEKQPANRYPNPSQLAEELRRWLDGKPIKARSISSPERVWRWCTRNPALAGALSTAFLALTAGLAIASWQWRNASLNLARATHQNKRAERNVDRLEDLIDGMLSQVAGALEHIPQMEGLRQRLLKQALEVQQQLIEEEVNDPRVRLETARAYFRIAKIYLMTGDYNLALEACTESLRLMDDAGPAQISEALEKSEVQLLISRIHYGERNLASAEDAARQAIVLAESVQESTDSVLVTRSEVWRFLGEVLERQNKNPAAEEALQLSVALLDQVAEDSREIDYFKALSRGCNSLAIVQRKLRQPAEAKVNFQRSIDIAETIAQARPDQIDVRAQIAATSYNLGNLYFVNSDFAAAVESYQRSYETYRALSSSFPMKLAYREFQSRASRSLGMSYRKQGQNDLAKGALEEAVEIAVEIDEQLGENPRVLGELVLAYNSLGNLLVFQLEDYDGGQDAFQEGMVISHRLVAKYPENGNYRNSLALTIGNLATMYVWLDEYEKACDKFRDSLQVINVLMEEFPGNPRYESNAAYQYSNLILPSCHLGYHDEAIDSAQELCDLDPGSADYHVAAARELSKCIPVLQVAGLDEATGDPIINRYANQAIAFFEQAIELGFSKFEEIESSDDFAPLRAYEPFQELLDRHR